MTGHAQALPVSLGPAIRVATSWFPCTGTAPKDLNTSLRTSTGSVHTTFSGFTMLCAMNPRARASAIWPAPMNPTFKSPDILPR